MDGMKPRLRKRTVALSVALVLVAALVSACGAGDARVTKEDSGGEVTIGVGNTLEVALESNPSTGYSWLVADVDSEVLSQAGEPSFESEDAEDVVGAGGTEVFAFEGASSGRTTLKLDYLRPWELEDAEETFEITVIVE